MPGSSIFARESVSCFLYVLIKSEFFVVRCTAESASNSPNGELSGKFKGRGEKFESVMLSLPPSKRTRVDLSQQSLGVKISVS